MKFVIYNNHHSNPREYDRIFAIIKPTATRVVSKADGNIAHIYIQHGGQIYQFNRYDAAFISAVETAIDTRPNPQSPGINYTGAFCIVSIEANKKYTINRSQHVNGNETLAENAH